jgi:hypothetical protein
MTPIALENLRRLVASKATLLKKALGTDSLPMTEHSDRIEFGWFRPTDDQAELAAYHKGIHWANISTINSAENECGNQLTPKRTSQNDNLAVARRIRNRARNNTRTLEQDIS